MHACIDVSSIPLFLRRSLGAARQVLRPPTHNLDCWKRHQHNYLLIRNICYTLAAIAMCSRAVSASSVYISRQLYFYWAFSFLSARLAAFRCQQSVGALPTGRAPGVYRSLSSLDSPYRISSASTIILYMPLVVARNTHHLRLFRCLGPPRTRVLQSLAWRSLRGSASRSLTGRKIWDVFPPVQAICSKNWQPSYLHKWQWFKLT
jgi:hypothetical protein